MLTPQQFTEIRQSGSYSHSRAGRGCWRDQAWVYVRDAASPSGVRLAGAIPLDDPQYQAAPLSPTEGL